MFDKQGYQKQYYQKNKETLKAYARNYHREHQDEANLARRVWSQTHKEQEKETGKAYYQAHKEIEKEQSQDYYQSHRLEYMAYFRKRRNKLKLEVLAHYSINGKPKCSYCEITDTDVLCIDHINNNGSQHRRQIGGLSGSSFYKWLKKNGYPSGYQVLCWNCNMKKRMNGGE